MSSLRNHFSLSYAISPILIGVEILLLTLIAYSIYASDLITESSFVEIAQVLLLWGTIALCLRGYVNKQIPLTGRQCFIILAFILFLVINRELSYGRVFYHDESIKLSAEMKVELSQHLPIKILKGLSYLSPILALLYFIKQGIYKSLLPILLRIKIYLPDFIFMLLCLLACTIAERAFHHDGAEEFFECVLYTCIFNISWRYANNRDHSWGC